MNPTDTLGRDGKRPDSPHRDDPQAPVSAMRPDTQLSRGPGHPAGGHKPNPLTILWRHWQLWRADRQWCRAQIADAEREVACLQAKYDGLRDGTIHWTEWCEDYTMPYGRQDAAIEECGDALDQAQRELDALLRGVGADR